MGVGPKAYDDDDDDDDDDVAVWLRYCAR